MSPDYEMIPSDTTETAPQQLSHMGLGDLLYGVLAQPVVTFRRLNEGGYLGSALTIFVLGQLVASYLNLKSTTADPQVLASLAQLMQTTPQELSALMGQLGVAAIVVQLLTAIIFLVVEAGIFYLLAELFKGSGRAQDLLSGLGLASFPATLGAALGFLLVQFTGASFFASGISLASGLWVMGLKIIAIGQTTRLSLGRAMVVCFLPLLVMMFVVAVIAVMAVMLLATWFSRFGTGTGML